MAPRSSGRVLRSAPRGRLAHRRPQTIDNHCFAHVILLLNSSAASRSSACAACAPASSPCRTGSGTLPAPGPADTARETVCVAGQPPAAQHVRQLFADHRIVVRDVAALARQRTRPSSAARSPASPSTAMSCRGTPGAPRRHQRQRRRLGVRQSAVRDSSRSRPLGAASPARAHAPRSR